MNIAAAVGTTVKVAPLRKRRGRAVSKFHCLCMMESGDEIYITIKADTEAEATEKVHNGESGYKGVEYVLETFTPLQMERKKQSLRRSLIGNTSAM
jgi:hypothetical protein